MEGDYVIGAFIGIIAVIIIGAAFAIGQDIGRKDTCEYVRLRIGTDAYQAAMKAEICKTR